MEIFTSTETLVYCEPKCERSQRKIEDYLSITSFKLKLVTTCALQFKKNV